MKKRLAVIFTLLVVGGLFSGTPLTIKRIQAAGECITVDKGYKWKGGYNYKADKHSGYGVGTQQGPDGVGPVVPPPIGGWLAKDMTCFKTAVGYDAADAGCRVNEGGDVYAGLQNARAPCPGGTGKPTGAGWKKIGTLPTGGNNSQSCHENGVNIGGVPDGTKYRYIYIWTDGDVAGCGGPPAQCPGSTSSDVCDLGVKKPLKPSTADIKANGSDGPITIPYGTAADLTWTSTNSTSCSATGAWGGTKGTSGSESTGNLTNPPPSYTYTITCVGDAESPASNSVTVNVSAPNAPSVTLVANPSTIDTGGNSNLQWTSQDATECHADGGPWSGDKNIPSGNENTTNLTQNTTFKITCTGQGGTSASSNATVIVNQPPVVNAGADQTIDWPDDAQLVGTATDDGLPTPPGALTTTWSKFDGPGDVTFSDPSNPVSSATFTAPGTYTLRLTATDGSLSSSDDVTIVDNAGAGNQPPVVNAGVDQTITWPNPAELAGSATDDGLPLPPTLTYIWSKFDGPGNVTFVDPSNPATSATFSTPGSYTLRLSVSDGDKSAFDDVVITDNPGDGNEPPTCPLSTETPPDSLGRTIVNFTDAYNPTLAWMGTKSAEPHSQASQNATLVAGNYRITLAEWDDHANQKNCVQSGNCPAEWWQQPNERYHLNLVKPGGALFGTSGDTLELGDDEDLRTDVTNANIVLPDLASVQPFHSDTYPDESNSNSIVALCAAFDRLAPPGITISADPISVDPNGTTEIVWESTNATSCEASGGSEGWPFTDGPLEGSWTSGSLTDPSYTYVLTCTGPGGESSDSVTVTVGDQGTPVITSFTANPMNVPYNGTTTLSWTSTGATSCVASKGSGGWPPPPATRPANGSWISGNLINPPAPSYTYTLVCNGPGGSSEPKSVTVTVGQFIPPPSIIFVAAPNSVPPGGTSRLGWQAHNVVSCEATSSPLDVLWTGSKPFMGTSMTSALNQTTVYTLTCLGLNGQTKGEDVQVTVGGLTFSIDLKARSDGAYGDKAQGPVPLNGLDLRAITSGTAKGPVDYLFDCDNGQAPIHVVEDVNTKDILDACDYVEQGIYNAKVTAMRSGIVDNDTAEIIVALACQLEF